MNDLITIKDNDGQPGVDARELHEFLQVGTRFDIWLNRQIEKYGFIDGQDFCSILIESTGGRPSTEYTLSLDMAKELAMVENNEQGRKARRYFIEVEKRYRGQVPAIPQTYAEALQLAADQARQIERQTAELEQSRPAVQFYADVTGSKDAIEMSQAAKIIDCGMGRNKLFGFLRDMGVLRHNNEPYQDFIDRGWFRVVEQKYTKPDGSTHITIKTMVYLKGIYAIIKLIMK